MNIKKALVVDDSKVAHATLRKLLLDRGVEVDWVGSGEDCIKYLDTKKPDIIFMDVMMPGMDGFETSRTVTSQKLQGSPPIVMCSANATDEDKRDAKNSGAVGFLSKPYTREQLDEVLRMVDEGVVAIAVEAPVAPPAPVKPTVVEKAPPPPPAAPPIPPPTAAPITAPVAEVAAVSTGAVEQVAERAAWAAAEKVSRDLIQELVPNLTREIALQTARGVAEDLGRRAAHAAVRAAQEAAKQVATEIARGTAEKTARTAAQESARAVAEQAAREVSEGVSQRNVARGLEINRDELLKQIDEQVGNKTRETLGMITGTPEFKQQIIQVVRSGIQPVIETIARETAERTVQQASTNLTAQGGGSGGGAALIVAIIAALGAIVALLRGFNVF
ncbi:MAG: response regulator [Candidatus Contendobacter sp.]|nr:response regulator [Candidatus Contendobacter sp.]MDS4059967.1 response regulator [Candidatus Contendobacter sp.]